MTKDDDPPGSKLGTLPSGDHPEAEQLAILNKKIDDFVQKHNEDGRKANDRENQRYCVEKLVLIGVTAYTILTAFILHTQRDTESRQLRAYISHEPDGLRWGKEGSSFAKSLAYFETNFGLTPANDVKMFVCIKGGADAPPDFSTNGQGCRQLGVMKYVAPKQNIGQFVAAWDQSNAFFLWGHIDYSDAFGGQWRRRFAWNYDPARVAAGFDKMVAHDTHNDELECKHWQCDP